MRLGILSFLPTPYWEPLYRTLANTADLRVRVFYLQPQDSLRRWSEPGSAYEAVQLRCWTPEWMYPLPVLGLVNPGAAGAISRFGPDCILVHGYSYWAQAAVIRWAIRTSTPYLLWGDSNAKKIRHTGAREWVKRRWLEYLCRHAAGVLTIGSSNREFWAHYGVGPERQFFAPLAADLPNFTAAARSPASNRNERRRRGLAPDKLLLLFVGRLVRRKNVHRLLQALAAHRNQGGAPPALLVAGDGPERAALQALAGKLGLRDVHWLGFRPRSELADLYALADALVLPSTDEPWGLVVNEAMAAGLPVLLSRNVGCVADLLEESVNGFSFDAHDLRSLTECLDRFSQLDESRRLAMGARSRQIISSWSSEATLQGIYRALESAVDGWRAPAAQMAVR